MEDSCLPVIDHTTFMTCVAVDKWKTDGIFITALLSFYKFFLHSLKSGNRMNAIKVNRKFSKTRVHHGIPQHLNSKLSQLK